MTTFYVVNQPTYYRYQAKEGGKPPYGAPKAYTSIWMRGTRSHEETYTSADAWATVASDMDHDEWNRLIMLSYERLKDKFSDRASLGQTMAEGRESIDMIARRALQVAQAFKSIKSGNLEAINRLARNAKRAQTKARQRNDSMAEDMFRDAVKSGSKNLLEYQWGWVPLVTDIHDAMKVMTEPMKQDVVTGRAEGPHHRYYVRDYAASNQYGVYVDICIVNYFLRVEQGARISIDNPNLWLANQLGLVNPIQSGLEVIPFSFVADWFINLSQVAGALTDFAGLSVSHGYTTKHLIINSVEFDRKNTEWIPREPIRHSEHNGYWLQRTPGVLLPQLGFRLNKPWGVNRCLNAMALATTLFVQDRTQPLTKYSRYLK